VTVKSKKLRSSAESGLGPGKMNSPELERGRGDRPIPPEGRRIENGRKMELSK
jgi:hypothetical protein